MDGFPCDIFSALFISICSTSYSLMFNNNKSSVVFRGQESYSQHVPLIYATQTQSDKSGDFVTVSDHVEVISTLRFLCQNMSCRGKGQTAAHLRSVLYCQVDIRWVWNWKPLSGLFNLTLS